MSSFSQHPNRHRSTSLPIAAAMAASVMVGAGCAHAQSNAPTPSDSTQTTPAAAMPTGLITVHYHRFDGNYDQVELWTWDERKQKNPPAAPVGVARTTDFGVLFEIDPSLYGEDDGDAERIGFIPRLKRDWNFKDGADRFWTPALGREVWLIGNDPTIYTTRPDISPRVSSAKIDTLRDITLSLSHPLPEASRVATKFTVKSGRGAVVPVASVRTVDPRGIDSTGKGRFLVVTTAEDLDVLHDSYEVAIEGYRPAVANPRGIYDDPVKFYTEEPMGAILGADKTTFRIFSPTAQNVSLVLFDTREGAGRREMPMNASSRGVWSIDVPGNLDGKFYKLKVTSARYGEQEIIDPFATNTTGTGTPARITDMRATDPPDFRPVARPDYGRVPTDAVIYQLSVRDFSIHASSGVKEDWRGRFLAFTQTGTTLPGDASIKTGIDHLRELGVTHVQLQPMQDFDNDEDNPEYNWGYMTSFFDSPEGWFATNGKDESRVREFKALVQALHEAGIGVIMDVVYNHTGTQNTFDKLAPGYYLRQRDDGSFWNGSGTGNEFRSESPMGRRFIVDSCKFWVEEYGVDGFRFDLMGLIDLETMLAVKEEIQETYPDALVYGEPWAAAGPDGVGVKKITYKDVVRGTGLGAFNDHFRDSLKGSPDGDDAGYVQNGSKRDGVLKGIEGSINDWAANPAESINYVSVHDNLDIWDKLKKTMPGTSDEDRARVVKMTYGILATSQGIMLIHGGSDFARDKKGNHNSYNAGDEVNQIDWTRKKTFLPLHEYTRQMIALRRAHPLFRLPTGQQVRERLKWTNENLPAPEAIAFTIDGRELPGESWKRVAVFINPTQRELSFVNTLGQAGGVYSENGTASAAAPLRVQSGDAPVKVAPRSVTVIAIDDSLAPSAPKGLKVTG